MFTSRFAHRTTFRTRRPVASLYGVGSTPTPRRAFAGWTPLTTPPAETRTPVRRKAR